MSEKNQVQMIGNAPSKTDTDLKYAQDAATNEHNLGLRAALRLSPKGVFWSLMVSTAIIMEGYDTMLMGNLYAQPAFAKRFGHLTKKGGYEIPTQWQVALGNGSVCGQLLGLIASGWLSERFGLRKTMIGGLTMTIGFIFILFFSTSLPMLLTGQILFGTLLGLFQTIPVVYAMEVAPSALRPYLTAYVNSCWAIGKFIGSGVLRGSLSAKGELAYKIPFGVQWFWPVLLIPILFFAPESPWWHVRKGNLDEARAILRGLTSDIDANFDVDKQISLMVVTTEHERTMNAETTYYACFKGVDRRRTLIAMGIYCVQTLSGNSLRGYSTYFLTKAGLPSVQAFNMSLVNNAMALTGGLFTWVLLPHFGRRTIYVSSLVLMMIIMLLIGGLGLNTSNHSLAWGIGALLIISSFLYNCTMGAITNTLCSEIPSTLLRSKSIVVARFTYSATGIAAGVLTPYQLNSTAWNWGAKTGFFWAGGCFIAVVFAFFCVPETKGRTTAEIDILFERRVSPRKFSGVEINLLEAIGQETVYSKV